MERNLARPTAPGPAAAAILAILALLATAGAPASAVSSKAAKSTPAEPRRIRWMEGVENAYPRWSNDGRRILFQSNRGGKWQLYVMDADGKNERRISDGKSNDNFPDWSPDNAWVAFVSDRAGSEDVYVMRMDGTGLASLAPHPARDLHPYWAPGGRTLLFNSTRDAEHFQIYSIRPDGSAFRRLTTTADDQTCARLAPDGKSMVWLANLTTGQDDIFVADSLARFPMNVTHDAAADGWPTWTPDGRRIVYASGNGSTFALWSMNPDGTDRKQITTPDAGWSDARPSVSPDGTRIVFNRASGKTIGIYVMELSPESDRR